MFKCDKARVSSAMQYVIKLVKCIYICLNSQTPSILADTKKRKAVTVQTTKQQHKQPICD